MVNAFFELFEVKFNKHENGMTPIVPHGRKWTANRPGGRRDQHTPQKAWIGAEFRRPRFLLLKQRHFLVRIGLVHTGMMKLAKIGGWLEGKKKSKRERIP